MRKQRSNRIQFAATDQKRGIYNGTIGTIAAIDGSHVAVKLDGGKEISFDTAAFDRFRHGYAGTIFKGQGDTVDQAYLYHSEHWRSAASYVGMTRHREKAALFVARNTAPDLDQLARQMGRIDTGKRYAASNFYQQDHIGPVRPMPAPEILARFGREMQRDQSHTPERARRQSAYRYRRDGTAVPHTRLQRAPKAVQTPEAGRASLAGDQPQPQSTAASRDEDLSKRITEIIDDNQRRRSRDERPETREDRFSSERTGDRSQSARDEAARPRYDRYTGERLDEAGRSAKQQRGPGRGRTRSR